jgi:hypothetical protein
VTPKSRLVVGSLVIGEEVVWCTIKIMIYKEIQGAKSSFRLDNPSHKLVIARVCDDEEA